MTGLPRAASLALWLRAWLSGSASADDLLASQRSGLHHVFIGLDQTGSLRLLEAMATIRRLDTGVALALTAPGSPTGLAGPPTFNAAAMEHGQALLLPQAQRGLIPVQVGGALEWRASQAHAPAPLDPHEARQHLRGTLHELTAELVDLGIASWSSEIPDLLLNRHDPLDLPDSVSPRDVQALERAVLCLSIVRASADVEPGAINAAERSRFERTMRRLDDAARRAIVAICSVPLR